MNFLNLDRRRFGSCAGFGLTKWHTLNHVSVCPFSQQFRTASEMLDQSNVGLPFSSTPVRVAYSSTIWRAVMEKSRQNVSIRPLAFWPSM